ncbi:MAG TPA: hypothetical protein VL099_09795 [Candidatus Binatia bacterium]|nr:hypothetical protein [Candidatus Binatia bacterium]
MTTFLILGLLALSTSVSLPMTVPTGTILAVELNSSLSTNKCKPGQEFTARVMQKVPLPDGTAIPAGSKLVGHVIRVNSAAPGTNAELAFQFDTLKTSRGAIPLTTKLRAVASYMEIDDAQIPAMGADRGTMPAAYTTVQVGGDVVYRGGGPVMNGSEVVGEPVGGGVLVHPRPNATFGCRGAVGGNDQPQAFWVFASDACGVYGIPGLSIAQTGLQNPLGEIVLTARAGELKVSGGTGLLLRVIREGA